MKNISFIIPVYNEAERLTKTFEALKSVLLPSGLKLEEVIFINDGSTDSTLTILNRGKKGLEEKLGTKIEIISYDSNRGKGYAVRTGMKKAAGDYILLFDADISTPLSELEKFVTFLGEKRIIIGTRKNGRSTVIEHQPIIRELLGKVFTKMTQIVLRTEVSDFTCGFKLLSRDAYSEISRISVINKWGYDAEIIYLAEKNGFDIVEIPVAWSNDIRTKVKIHKAIPETILDLAKIVYTHDFKPYHISNIGIIGRITSLL